MALKGPILLVDDDRNDAEVVMAALKDIGIPNEVLMLDSADAALDYLLATKEQPYIILSDIRMPGVDGLTFRSRIMENEYLRKKAIPFVFFTGAVSTELVNAAYDLDVQGFFRKGANYDRIKEQLLSIFIYWRQCLHPNRTDLVASN